MPPPRNDFASTARVTAPPASLASCVRAYVVRDTTGRTLLPAQQRFNHFPVSAMCSISWILEGEVHVPGPVPAMPRIALGGPQTRPRTSYNPGQVHVFIALFFPQALHALTGIDMSSHVDRFVPLDAVADAPWQGLSKHVMAAPDDDARARLLGEFLEPRWQAARASGAAPGGVMGDWVNSMALHVAMSGWGRSARNIERRIKVWAGQPLRGLRRIQRAERAFLETRADMQAGTVSWADAAAEGGFADQAHLCREVRAVTGRTPTQLARLINEDESYWVYRIWS
jgi:hypothetical protein